MRGHQERGEGASEFDALTSICPAGDQSVDSATLISGTRCGHLITMVLSKQGGLTVVWTAEKLATAPIEVFSGQGLSDMPSAAFARCDDDLMMLKHICPWNKTFKSKTLVWATDSNDSSAASPPIHSMHILQWAPPTDQHGITMALLGDSRLLLTELVTKVGHVPLSIPVGGTPTRVICTQECNHMVVAIVRDDRPALVFINRRSGEIVPENQDPRTIDFANALGQPGDRISDLGEWFYVKDGITFRFILVATKGGQLFVLTATLKDVQTERGLVRRMELVSRHKKKHTLPIYSVVGDGDGIAYCVGQELQWNVLDPNEKKLRHCKSFELSSPATTLRVMDGRIFALTTSHSLHVIDHRTSTMVLFHADQISRSTTHMIELGDMKSSAADWPMMLVSELAGGIAGIWAPWGRRNREFSTVFEGALKTSIRRFVRLRRQAFGRPTGYRRRFGVLSSSADDSEIFGISVGGSMHHFTLLSLELWRLLFLIQWLARRDNAVCPFVPPLPAQRQGSGVPELDVAKAILQPEAKRMHIDGDVIERVFKNRMLPQVVGDYFDSYRGCLDQLKDGHYTQEFRINDGDSPQDVSWKRDNYYVLGHDILEHLFAPVL
jgi:hypothetical protein